MEIILLNLYSQNLTSGFAKFNQGIDFGAYQFGNPIGKIESENDNKIFSVFDSSIAELRNGNKNEIYSAKPKKWGPVVDEVTQLIHKFQLDDQLITKALDDGLSSASLKRIAPFLNDIDNSYMIDYIDKMEILLDLPSPTQIESRALYKKALNSIEIETQSDEFRSWIESLFLELTKSPLGKIVLDEWITSCEKLSLKPKVTQIENKDKLNGSYAKPPNEVVFDYKDEPIQYPSFISGMSKLPPHIILAHEMLHCVRGELIDFRLRATPMEPQLSNAEEEYTILGIEKGLFKDAKQNKISHRLLDYLSEAAFLLSERLPPKLAHTLDDMCQEEKISAQDPSLLFQLKRKFYKYIANYTKYELDIIPEHRENKNLLIEAMRRNCIYQYDSNLPTNDYKVMKNALLCDLSFYNTLAPYLTNKKGVKVISEVIKKQPRLINYIDIENPHYENFVSTALAHLHTYPPFPWKESSRLFKLEAVKTHRHIFKEFPEEDRADPEIALAAIRRDAWEEEFVAPSLKQNSSFQNQIKRLREERGERDFNDDFNWASSYVVMPLCGLSILWKLKNELLNIRFDPLY